MSQVSGKTLSQCNHFGSIEEYAAMGERFDKTAPSSSERTDARRWHKHCPLDFIVSVTPDAPRGAECK
jgi:hypothetical protein